MDAEYLWELYNRPGIPSKIPLPTFLISMFILPLNIAFEMWTLRLALQDCQIRVTLLKLVYDQALRLPIEGPVMAGPDEKASIGFAHDSISEERVTEAHTLAPVRRLVTGQVVTTRSPNKSCHSR